MDYFKAAAANATFLLVAGNDVNLLNIISNTVPTHFFFRVIMQPRKYIYFSEVVWSRDILKILVKEDRFLLWLWKNYPISIRRCFQNENEMNFLKGHLSVLVVRQYYIFHMVHFLHLYVTYDAFQLHEHEKKITNNY